ncbi:MAG: cation transporter [Clostridiales bacterium]|nr:cation transporter [Clostridiales bacterium]
MKNEQREKTIVRTSFVGIVVNILLAAFKAAVGIISNSIAVVLDAVNNLSDALSSVITIIGAKLAGKKPDRKHPLGHGRIEYISALLVAAIVLYAGITSLTESVKKIIDPVQANYSKASLIIIATAVVAKILLGRYVKSQGQKTGSGALIASGTDALSDAALSFAVLVTALVYIFTGLSLEAYVGVVISIFIIKAGYEMIKDTVSDILGRRADVEVSKKIKDLLAEEPEVVGAYDLFLHNYGPERNYGSVHVELPDNMTVREVDELTRRVQGKIYKETGVIMTGIGVYSQNTGSEAAANIRKKVEEIVLAHDWALQVHGFYLDEENKDMRFDVVISFDIQPRDGIEKIYEEVSAEFPDYQITIAPDVDITD